jgi:hypothetical protein
MRIDTSLKRKRRTAPIKGGRGPTPIGWPRFPSLALQAGVISELL